MNKKHMKKRLLIFAAAILMIITTVTVHYKTEVRSEAAGIKTQQETKKKIIGATLASSQASYQYAIGNLLVAEAEKDPDYKLEIQYAEWNVKKQEEQMRDFIRRKVDAIIFCPVNAKSYLNVLREAKNAGIPVINLNMKVDTVSAEYITTYVGASMSEEADLAGQLVVECLNGKKGKVGIIEGSQGTDPQIYRTQTFLEYLSSYPDVEVVGIEEANWSRAKAGLAASRLLSQNPDKLVEMMVGTPVKNFYENHKSMVQDEVVLKVEDYTHWGFFHHVNFELHKGEVLAICGLAGAGRTEIARALIGVDKADGGKVYIHGKETHFRNFGEAIAGGLGYLTEDRKVVGLALNQTVGDNVTSCIIDRNSNGIFYNQKKLNGLIDEKINEMSVYPADRDRLVNSFSGGNQQKVLMAKWLAAGVDILILDEPTRGVDVNAKQVIHNVVKDYVSKGNSVILLSSDLPEVVGLADRAVILREGHTIGMIRKKDMTENSILIAANGEGEFVSCQK